MNTAGLVFDIYDDSDKHILSALFEEASPSEKIASSTLLSHEELASLPDHIFAVVAANGGVPLRKYAMHDEPHLKLSVLYFCESGHLFPEETQKVAARNLIRGCRWYDIEPPGALVKMAFIGSTKRANITNTEVMPTGALKSYVAKNTTGKSEARLKVASNHVASVAIADRFIDDSWEKSAALDDFEGHTKVTEVQYEHFCLPHIRKYPIDSYELMKTADSYFCEHIHDIPFVDRRAYAQNLSARAEVLGIDVSEKVAAYTGDEYGPYIQEELVKRAAAFEGTGREVGYETLLSRLSGTPPGVMAVLIKEADEKTGADSVYGREVGGFRDPYQAVFGKHASPSYEWGSGKTRVTGGDLSQLAETSFDKLSEVFGSGFGDSFAKDPVGIFDSMPDPQKAVIAKMANQA